VQTVTLGRTGLAISRIGFGAWAAGGSEWFHGWSNQSDEDSIAAIERAVELGVNWIDTAAAYGFGHSEEIVGRVLAGVRDPPYVFTKCAALEGPPGEIRFSLQRDSLFAELEGSLLRLRADAVDLYQIHRPLPEAQLEEGWRTLAEMKERGLVRHIGVSNFTVEQLRRIEQIAPVETVQPPYSLLRPDAETDLLPFAARRDIGVIVYSPMGSGLLTGTMTRERFDALPDTDWRRSDSRFAEPQFSRGLDLAERLRVVGNRRGATPGEVAVAWTLRNPAVHGAIVGMRNAAQVDGVARAADLVLSDSDVEELEATR
jgi:aryl-alcohol dehydrogenase-like predicted oxidoreductase